jgi:hypothetical protein
MRPRFEFGSSIRSGGMSITWWPNVDRAGSDDKQRWFTCAAPR